MNDNTNKNFYFYSEVEAKWKGKSITRKASFAGVVKDNSLHIGQSVCSESDIYDKKKGRKIAEGRALKKPIVSIDLTKFPEDKISNIFVEEVKKFIGQSIPLADVGK